MYWENIQSSVLPIAQLSAVSENFLLYKIMKTSLRTFIPKQDICANF